MSASKLPRPFMASCWPCLGDTLLFLPYLQQQHWRVLLWTQSHVEDSSKDVPFVFISGPQGSSFLLQQGKLLDAGGKLNVLCEQLQSKRSRVGRVFPQRAKQQSF